MCLSAKCQSLSMQSMTTTPRPTRLPISMEPLCKRPMWQWDGHIYRIPTYNPMVSKNDVEHGLATYSKLQLGGVTVLEAAQLIATCYVTVRTKQKALTNVLKLPNTVSSSSCCHLSNLARSFSLRAIPVPEVLYLLQHAPWWQWLHDDNLLIDSVFLLIVRPILAG